MRRADSQKDGLIATRSKRMQFDSAGLLTIGIEKKGSIPARVSGLTNMTDRKDGHCFKRSMPCK